MRNRICHYQGGGSDKVYMVSVRKDAGKWLVLGKWGRRGNDLKVSIKGTLDDEAKAEAVMNQVFNKQLKEGYIDIESPSYSGPVTRRDGQIQRALEPEVGGVPSVSSTTPVMPITWSCKRCGVGVSTTKGGVCDNCKAEIEKEKNTAEADFELVCLDNIGMEDRFDLGITYLCEKHKDPTMLWVYDKLGRKDEYLRGRFGSDRDFTRAQKLCERTVEGITFN